MKKPLIFIFALILLVGLFSCEKENPTYKLKVTVLGQDTIPLQNVTVFAGAPLEGSSADFEEQTNEFGVAEFSYDYEAVFQVVAQKGNPVQIYGCDYVKLEADETVEITIFALAYDPDNPGC